MKKGVFRLFILFVIIVVVFSTFSNLNVQKQNSSKEINPSVVSGELKYGYVTDGSPYLNTVTVFNRETMQIIKNITVGYLPFGIVTSPNGSYIYVSNYNSNNVSVISTASNTVIKSINVGNSPGSIGITPNGLFVVVGNSASGTVNIINTKTYTNYIVNVGGNPGGYLSSSYATSIPDGVAFSPNNTFAYVSNADGNISVINLNTMSLFKQITVSNYPVNGLAISSNGNYLYVLINEYYGSGIDYGSHLSVISTKTFSILKNISTDWDPSSITLGPGDYNAYVTSYYNSTISVLNLTTNTKSYSISLPSNANPIGIYLSPENNSLYVADNSLNNISIINLSTNALSSYNIGIYPVGISFANLYLANFIESGLPSGTSWSVNVNSISLLSNKTNITFLEPNGSYSYRIGLVPGYKPSPSSGTFIVNGANLNILITFTIVTYNIKFVETGLPSGTPWSVTLNGTKESSSGNTIKFAEPNGSYSYSIETPISGSTGVQFILTQSKGTITVNGTNTGVNVTYITQYYLTMLANPSNGGIVYPGSGWYNASILINIYTKANTGFKFVSWAGNGNGSYSGKMESTTIDMNSPITEQANFVKVYNVVFKESGLKTGTSWSVTLNGTTETSTTGTITFNEPNGTYVYSIGSVSGYSISPSSGSITVNGTSVLQSIKFTLITVKTYTIIFVETGLPPGTSWSVTLNGTKNTSSTTSITFYEPNGTYTYSIQQIPGYSTAQYSGTITVSGSSITKYVIFVQTQQNEYFIIFQETGLPSGTSWSVTLNGTTKSTTGTSITFIVKNGTYNYKISFPSGYSAQYTTGIINVEGKSLVVPLNVSKSTPFPWLLIILIVIIIVVVIIILFILMKRKRPKQYVQGPGYYGQQAPPGPPPNYPPPQQQYPGYYGSQTPPGPQPNYPPQHQNPSGFQPQQNIPPTTYPENVGVQQMGQQYTTQNGHQNQPISEQEALLFGHPGAILLKIDNKLVSRPQYSGTIYITNKNFIFLSRGKGGSMALLFGGVATAGLIQKSLSIVDIQEINKYLNSNGSFIVSLSNISSISANVSSMLKGSFIKISTKVPVNPYGTKISGYNVEFTFLPKGYIGAAILKKEEADYINTTIAQMVGK
ncbi:MAG: YncE family protein [Thermoplasmata archaeon]